MAHIRPAGEKLTRKGMFYLLGAVAVIGGVVVASAVVLALTLSGTGDSTPPPPSRTFRVNGLASTEGRRLYEQPASRFICNNTDASDQLTITSVFGRGYMHASRAFDASPFHFALLSIGSPYNYWRSCESSEGYLESENYTCGLQMLFLHAVFADCPCHDNMTRLWDGVIAEWTSLQAGATNCSEYFSKEAELGVLSGKAYDEARIDECRAESDPGCDFEIEPSVFPAFRKAMTADPLPETTHLSLSYSVGPFCRIDLLVTLTASDGKRGRVAYVEFEPDVDERWNPPASVQRGYALERLGYAWDGSNPGINEWTTPNCTEGNVSYACYPLFVNDDLVCTRQPFCNEPDDC